MLKRLFMSLFQSNLASGKLLWAGGSYVAVFGKRASDFCTFCYPKPDSLAL